MDPEKNIIDGYEFESFAAFDEAKAEAERVTYLRANTDLRSEDALKKLYEDCTAEGAEPFRTPVGLGFLREVQRRVAKDPDFKKSMKAIYVPSRRGSSEISEMKINDLQNRYNALKRRTSVNGGIKNVVILFLVILVIALFVYEGMMSKKRATSETREEILNEYAGWADELTKKENELNEREALLNERMNGNGQD
ncbi:MAG: hypothetical protein IKS09_00995 [Lachnospiraceae bacterium]|nr:hypothetical protein [Lachnospiraceae bacterium]